MSTAGPPRQALIKTQGLRTKQWVHYSRIVLTVTILKIVYGKCTEIEVILVHNDVNMRLKPTLSAALVDRGHRFAALSQLASKGESNSL